MTGAMCSILDRLEWYVPTEPGFVYAKDPLEEMDWNF